MKVKIGTIQVKPDHVAMFTEVLDRYVEAEKELAAAQSFMATKSFSTKIPEIRARRDEKRAALVSAYSDLLDKVQP